MLQYEYARSALRLGLKLGHELGVNPYKLGMNASTDTHTGLSTSREENYFGKMRAYRAVAGPVRPRGRSRPTIRRSGSSPRRKWASGMTAVWTRENSRKAIFDALTRKEVYATTGTRIRVRVFGGWDFTADDMAAPDFVAKGYRNGVPMGGELRDAPAGKAPSFMIQALRDPDGANLDRVQVIKGWLDAAGETHERIYDVAVSGGRTIGADGRAREPVGTTVDIPTATYANSIGAASFAALVERSGLRPGARTPSTTSACWRSRRRAGRPTTRRSSGFRCPTWCRRRCRTGPTPRRSGTRRADPIGRSVGSSGGRVPDRRGVGALLGGHRHVVGHLTPKRSAS